MSNSNGIDVKELPFPASSDYNDICEKVFDTTNGNSNNQQTPNHYGETWPVTLNENKVTCPNCQYCFSTKEQKKKGTKRSASSSVSTKKKRPSQ